MAEGPGSPSRRGPGLAVEGEQTQVKLLVNKDGRYVYALPQDLQGGEAPGPQGAGGEPGLLAPPSLSGA